jgi:hypothetical protein
VIQSWSINENAYLFNCNKIHRIIKVKKKNAASFSHTMLPIELTPQPHVYVCVCVYVWGGELAQSVACETVNPKVWGSVPIGTAI